MANAGEDEQAPGPATAVADALSAGSGPRVARQFRQAYPWVDTQAIEACLGVMDANAGHSAAIARYYELRGVRRTQARFAVLRALYFAEEGRLAQHEIRNDMRVTSPNVSKLIDGLEREGLVTRTPDTNDRRVTYVKLTPRGREVATDLIPAMAQFMAHLLRGFSDEEKATFNQLLERFRQNAASSYLEGATEA